MEEGEQERPEWTVGHEDEYDALNDETFGDTGEEYTWGDSQALLFEDTPKAPAELNLSNSASNGYSKGSVPHAGTPSVGFGLSLNEPTSKETEYYDYENDNALEESISRLVLDDLEDMEDEEEAKKIKLSRLGTTSNFSTYFMPPQVATKHLHWLMDKELPGGSSLLGSSVWSMHPTTTALDNVSNNQSMITSTPIRTLPTSMNNLIQQHQQPLRPNFMSSDDVVDGENNVSKFFGGVHSSTPLNTAASKKPVFKTVEEIERELLEEGTKVSPKLPEENMMNHSKPKVLMAEDLERELIQESPMPMQKTPGLDNRGRSPLRNLSQLNQIHLANQESPTSPYQNQLQSKPAQTPQQSHHMLGQQQQQQHQHQQMSNASNMGASHPLNFNNLPDTPPAMNANTTAVNNFLMMEQQKQMLLARQGLLPVPPHPALHPGMVPGGPIPPQLMQGFHPGLSPLPPHQQQQHIRMLQMNPQLRGRLPLIMPLPAVMAPHLRPHVLSQMGFTPPQNMGPGYRKHMKTDDPYRGLMNEKDKQRLRNIQIIQLQNDHPFTTDYYNLMHKAKQAAPGGLQLLIKLYPKRDDEAAHKSNYEPARFENCLGKLQAVSALAPKRVIDTFIRVTECRSASRGGAFRYLLLEIEKLYECLLVMEESDIRMSILCNADEKDVLRRSQNADKVAKILTSNEKFLSIISVPKGKMLICRALPLIDPSVRYKILGHLLDIFPLWGHGTMDKAFPYLRHCILHAEIRDLLSILAGITDSQMFESIVITRLGISVLTCLFHQAEQMLATCEAMLAEDIESHWTRKSSFGISAILLKSDELANPIEFYPNFLQHIRRFALHSNDVQTLESIVQRWANAGIPARLVPSA